MRKICGSISDLIESNTASTTAFRAAIGVAQAVDRNYFVIGPKLLNDGGGPVFESLAWTSLHGVGGSPCTALSRKVLVADKRKVTVLKN